MMSRLRTHAPILILLAALVLPVMPARAQSEVTRLLQEGMQLMGSGNIQGALAALSKAASLAPQSARVQEALGVARFRAGDFPASLDALQKAVAGAPDRCMARTGLAQTQAAMGEVDAAMESLREAVRREAACVPPRIFLAGLLGARGEYAAAIPPLRQAVGLTPATANPAVQLDVVMRLAEVLHRAGRLSGAIEVLSRVTGDRAFAAAHLQRAKLLRRMRRLEEAELVLLQLMTPDMGLRGEQLAEVHEQLSIVLLETDRYADAIKLARQASTELRPRAQADYVLARARALQGDLSGALQSINRARQGLGDVPLVFLVDPIDVYRPPASSKQKPRFVDIGRTVGLGDRGKGRGSTWADLDGDGDLDLIVGSQEFTSVAYYATGELGGPLRYRRAPVAEGIGDYDSGYTNLVGDLNGDGHVDVYGIRGGYQNDRDGFDPNVLLLGGGGAEGVRRFTEAGFDAGAADAGQGFSGTLADLDADGDLDIYVVNYQGPNRLLLNRGDATFDEVGATAGVDDAGGGQGIAAGDVDGDGDTDLFVANKHDRKLPGEPGNVLYLNDGPGSDGVPRFREVAAAAGVRGDGNSFAPVFADLDRDGDLDLFVASFNFWTGRAHRTWDGEPGVPHRLYRNDGVGEDGVPRFTEIGEAAGITAIGGSMGVSAGDLDNDGWIDIYVSLGGPELGRREPDLVLRNQGGMKFQEVGRAWDIANPGRSHGVTMVDVDEDGDLDIYVPNGAFYPGDGAPDRFYRNDSAAGHWLQVRLQGPQGNPTAIGSRVTVRAGDALLVRELQAGSGFCSQDPPYLHFGLGDAASYDSLEVRWPDGRVTRHPGSEASRILELSPD